MIVGRGIPLEENLRARLIKTTEVVLGLKWIRPAEMVVGRTQREEPKLWWFQ